MSTSPYLLHVTSKPKIVSNDVWKQWYTTEHIPDLVNNHIATRAAFYEEIPHAMNTEPSHPRPFLVLYQTDFEEPMKNKNFSNVRPTSQLFKSVGSPSDSIPDNGDMDVRNYSLLNNFDPNNSGETLSAQILTVEMDPSDPDSFGTWDREEYLSALQKLPGHRRTLCFKLGPEARLTPQISLTQGLPPKYLAIHYVDDVSAVGGNGGGAANTNSRRLKYIEQGSPAIVRGWKLIKAFGYSG